MIFSKYFKAMYTCYSHQQHLHLKLKVTVTCIRTDILLLSIHYI